ncbi:DUF4335 domain-containing protein [Aerosakkonemataceae cyanobacterium BLCC-F154]|uniref:DUF4335 domain-containing protein n=1 Tax=Floridaenema fluviatile BLCC-F154 TaxID=3153640 RepID=A0ABV4YFP6_9CYAN
MTIKRQYSLPNCTIILEGLSETTGGITQEIRPILSILVNAECRLAGYTGPSLSGGRDFFESLVTAVSNYAQTILSGVPHQHLDNGHVPLVELRRNGQNIHRLIVQPHNLNVFSPSVTAPPVQTTPIEVDLSTVQLFDLVEAVDQFFADSQTLPSLKLQLAPVEKRFAKTDEDLVKQAAPAALGLSSLALAAIALFFAPIPEVQRPREPLPESNSGAVSPNSTIPGQTAPFQPTPLPPTTTTTTPQSTQSNLGVQTTTPVTSNPPATPLTTEVPPTTSNLGSQTSPVTTPAPLSTPTTPATDSTAVQPTPAPLTTPTDSTAVQPTPAPLTAPTDSTAVQLTPAPVPTIPPTESSVGLQTPATTLPPTTPSTLGTQTPTITTATVDRNNEIVDTPSLRILNRNLYRQIQQRRTEVTKFPEQLVFRVAMRPDGTVVNYEPRNQSAQEYVNQTPLPNMGAANVPIDSPAVNQQPVAYFKVVFTPKGVLQVSPWRGYR